MKPSFEVIDFNLEIISRLATDAYDFCTLWRTYLSSCGWTEEEYEAVLEHKAFFMDVN